MVKRKAEQGSEVGAEAKSAELGDMPAEVLTPQEQTVHTVSRASPVNSQGVPAHDGEGSTSDVVPQGVEGCNRNPLPTDPVGADRLTSPTVTEEAVSPTAVVAEGSEAANWLWLLLDRTSYEAW